MPMELVTELPYDHPYRWDGTRFGGPKLWRPSNIGSSLALWLDAEDSASITLNGSAVSQWNDKSGNGRNATQATAASQPAYSASGLNNKPAVSFDGINDVLLHDAISLKTIYAVAKTTATTTFKSIAGAQATVGTGPEGAYYLQGGNPARTSRFLIKTQNGVYSSDGDIFDSGVPFSLGGVIDSGNNITVYLNGKAGPPSAASGTMGIGQSYVGAAFFSGAITDFWLGEIAEVIVSNNSLTTSERQRIEGYLAWKWKLQANLPSTHPFKNLPPTV